MQDVHTLQDIKNAQWLSLSGDEDVVWWGHPSLLPRIPTIVFGVIIAIIGLWATWRFHADLGWAPLVLIPIGAGLSIFEYLKHITTFYVLTSNKLTEKYGIVSRDTIDIRYSNIEHARVSQSIPERLFGYGDIEVATAGTAVSEVTMENVTEPKEVGDLIDTGKDLGRIPSNEEERQALIDHRKYPNGSKPAGEEK